MTIEYDYSIVKIDKDGNSILSNKLEKGEKLLNGASYKDELKRLGKEPESSPFAQGTLTEHNNPTDPVPALTVTSDGVNTRRADDPDTEPAAIAPFEPELVATESTDGNSTVIVKPDENNQATPEATKAVEEGKTITVDPPKDSDSKQEWFDYATEHKGLTAEYDDVTKNQIIAFVGEQN